MADFCNQCAEHLSLPAGDLKGLGDGTKLEEGFGWIALCEGCGLIMVDDEGNCIVKNCWRDHETGRFK